MGKIRDNFIRGRLLLLTPLSFFLLALILRIPLINPPSLWLDDAWASLVIKSTNLHEFIVTTSHTPILLSLITKVSGALISDKEIGPQLFPFLVSCLSVPCFFWIATKITGSLCWGLLCGFLLAFNPQSVYYASHVKPYPGDILAGILSLSFMSRLISREEKFPLGSWIFFCLLTPLISFASLIIIGSFYLNGLFWVFLKSAETGIPANVRQERLPGKMGWKKNFSKDGKAKAFFLSGLIFLVFIAFYYWLLLRGQMNPRVKLFWQDQAAFMPVEDLLASIHFLSDKIQCILRNALDINPIILIFFLALSIVIFSRERDKRYLVSFYFFLYLTAIGLSAIKIYPMSGERTDSYFLPFNIFFISGGSLILQRYFPKRLCNFLIILIPFALFLHFKQINPKYPDSYNLKPLVKILERNYEKGDAIVCWPHANWGLGYYTNWKIRFIPSTQYSAAFVSALQRPHFYLLNDDFYFVNENVSQLERVAGQYNRIWYIVGFYDIKYDINAELLYGDVFLKNGFRLSRNFRTKGAFLKMYQRPDPSQDPGQ